MTPFKDLLEYAKDKIYGGLRSRAFVVTVSGSLMKEYKEIHLNDVTLNRYKIVSISDLLFGPTSGFLECFEWVSPDTEQEYICFMGEYIRDVRYYKMILSYLEDDEERIDFIEQNTLIPNTTDENN